MLVTVLLTLWFVSASHSSEGYYWREYLGVIPEDAFIGGKDIAGNNVYVGQAYIKDCGLVVVQITPGSRNVIAPIGGPKPTNKYTKILCGAPYSFYWMKSSAATLYLDLEGKEAVPGGHEDTYGVMNIGRISSGGQTRIGKVNTFWNASATFYYINENGEENLLNTYEILMFKDLDINIKTNELFS